MPKRVSLEGQVITDHDRLARTLKVLRTQGKVVTLLCTDTDVLGPGAVRAMRNAATRGNHLVVGLLDDESLEERDGAPPLLPQEQRGEVVAAVDGVDYVTFVGSEGVEELVRALRPTVAARCANEDAKGVQIEEAWAKEAGSRFAVVGDAKAESNRRFRRSLLRRAEDAVEAGSDGPRRSASRKTAPRKAGARSTATRKASVRKAAAKKVVKKASRKAASKATAKKVAKRKTSGRRAKAGTPAKKKVRATA